MVARQTRGRDVGTRDGLGLHVLAVMETALEQIQLLLSAELETQL